MFSSARKLKRINWYPPYIGAGIRISEVSPAMDKIVVTMRLTFWNKNVFGTHFGGSLYAMCDPFFVLIALQQLGKKNYIIWDKAASIQFKKPGKGRVKATFYISPETIAQIKSEIDQVGKKDYLFTTEVTNEAGETVAIVEKLIYIRKKDSILSNQ